MKKRNLLLSSIALLVVAVVGFAGATYAWFMTGLEPNISRLDIQVQDVGDILISAKKNMSTRVYGDFTYNLDISELQGIGSNGYYHNPNDFVVAEKLNATTIDTTGTANEAGLITNANANKDGDNIPRLAFFEEDKTNTLVFADDFKNFIAYDVFFANTGAVNYKVGVDLNPAALFGASVAKQPGTNFWVENTYTIGPNTYTMTVSQKELPKALKVAFVTYADGTAGAIDKIQVFDVNSSGLTTATEGTNAGNQVTPFQENYLTGVLTGTTSAGTNPFYTKTDTSYELFTLEPCAGVYYNATASALKIKQLSIYIWIEGNDPSCVSAIAGGYFSSFVQFVTLAV